MGLGHFVLGRRQYDIGDFVIIQQLQVRGG